MDKTKFSYKINKRKILILFILLIIILIIFVYPKERKFNKEIWNSKIWYRYTMIEDLTKNYNLYEMTPNDILNLLGTNGIVENSHYTYYVGKSFAGPKLFNVSIGDNGYVSSYGIIID